MAGSNLEAYSNLYPDIKLERHSGLLEVTFGVNKNLVWTSSTRSQIASLFRDIGSDAQNKVVIITGYGELFWKDDESQIGSSGLIPDWKVEALLESLIKIPVPIIAAINGPVKQYCEVPLLSDIVLAADGVFFQESQTNYIQSISDKEGRRLILQDLFGLNKARYFLLTEESLLAREAKQFGVVSEILEKRDLLNRAREIAFSMLRKSSEELILIRGAFLRNIQQKMESCFSPMRIWGVRGNKETKDDLFEYIVKEPATRIGETENELQKDVIDKKIFVQSGSKTPEIENFGIDEDASSSRDPDWNIGIAEDDFESFSLHGNDISELADFENESNYEVLKKYSSSPQNTLKSRGEPDEWDSEPFKGESSADFNAIKADNVSDMIKSVSVDGGENDVKLNLAKAYIELGYHPSAHLIIEEIVKNGTSEQVLEAERLKDEISNS